VKIAGDVYDTSSSSYTTTDDDDVLYHPTSPLDMIDDILQFVPDICCRLPDSSSSITKNNNHNSNNDGLLWMEECTTMPFPEACPSSLVVPFAASTKNDSALDSALTMCVTSAPESLMMTAATDFLMSASDVSIPSVSTDGEEGDIGDFLIDAEWLL
jgi:hypothetical protein